MVLSLTPRELRILRHALDQYRKTLLIHVGEFDLPPEESDGAEVAKIAARLLRNKIFCGLAMTDGYTFQELRRAIEQCNARKGYGTVTEFRRMADGTLAVCIARPHCRDIWRVGHVEGNRARFAGTSAKLRVLQSPDYN